MRPSWDGGTRTGTLGHPVRSRRTGICAIGIKEAIKTLSQAVSTPGHEFLSDDISLLDQQLFAHEHIQGPKQLTDIYLLALSVFHGARFVTLDEGVPHVAVLQATNVSVQVIKP